MCSLIFIVIISIVLTSILTINARVVKVGKFTMMSDAHSRCVSLKHWIFYSLSESRIFKAYRKELLSNSSEFKSICLLFSNAWM